jgi:hypothetical protein
VEQPYPIDSVEWKVLLAASAPDPSESELARILSLVREEQLVDWEKLLGLADLHGTVPLLYQNLERLRDLAPSSTMEELRKFCETNVRKALFLARELIRIVDCLEPLGIEAIPYKGLVMSEQYYGDMALRQAGDIDLFVRKKDVARVKNAVRDLGYTVRVPIPENAEKDYIATGYEYTFDSPAGKNVLEVKWALQPRFYSVDFDMEGLFKRAQSVMVAGRQVKTLAPEDLLLVLSIHAAKHVWGRIIWLRDIAQILRRENLNWKWVQASARRLGIERILHITLLLANRFMGAAIPIAMESMVLEDRETQAFVHAISIAVAQGVSYGENQVSYFRLMMRLRERREDRVRFFLRLGLTPGPGEWEAVRLPGILFPAYRLVRIVRLAARFARR